MPGQPVMLGPFIGGMNTYSGPATIADNEAVDILNMDVDLDGSLRSRPGFGYMTPPIVDKNSHILCVYRDATDVAYIIYAFETAGYAYNTSTGVWISLGANIYTSAVQYNDKLYLVHKPSGVTQGGSSWTPAGGVVAVATMPRGYDACIYKERMFISASRTSDETSINRVKFSNATNPEVWTSTDYFDVAAGDGQDIKALKVTDSSIVIFKSDSTYIYAYETAPSKGIVQVVSTTIGANNRYSVIEYESNLMVIHEANLYRISNWNWEHANIKVPFTYQNAYGISPDDSSSVSVIGNRLVCRYYDKYFVLGLKTGAWSRWEFNKRTNLVVNSSFEDAVSGWGGSATVGRSTLEFRTGVASLKVDTTAADQYTNCPTLVSDATPGKNYTSSIYIKGTGSARLRMTFRDAANVTITNKYTVNITLTSSWQRLEVTDVAPVGAAKVFFWVYQRTSGVQTFWLDDVMIEESNVALKYFDGTILYTPSEFISNPNIQTTLGVPMVYAGSYYALSKSVYTFMDIFNNTYEYMSIKILTKSYDFGPSYGFKRLFWWGVDTLARTNTKYKVTPLIYNTPVTWGQLATIPFNQYQTWGRPLEVTLDVTDSANISNASGYRTFIKLLKGLRFRQASFTIEATTDGTVDTGPYRIYSLTAFVDSKEITSKEVS